MELNRNSLSSFYVAVFLEKYVDEANQNQKKINFAKRKTFLRNYLMKKKTESSICLSGNQCSLFDTDSIQLLELKRRTQTEDLWKIFIKRYPQQSLKWLNAYCILVQDTHGFCGLRWFLYHSTFIASLNHVTRISTNKRNPWRINAILPLRY